MSAKTEARGPFGFSLETFKTPAAMLLLGMVLAGGGGTAIHTWLQPFGPGDDKKITALAEKVDKMEKENKEFRTEVRREIREIREGQVEQRTQIKAVSRQLDRLERKLDRR